MTALDNPDRWTKPTRYLDFETPALRSLASQLAKDRPDPRDRAIAAFNHVRDSIRFGFRPAFYDLTASRVLEGGVGFCNNQSTLMTALLRAMGVPARCHFVDIDAQVLSGVLDPRSPYVDHSWTEAWLDGRWVATDAYIVDPPLMRAARRRLKDEGRVLGHGAHVNGVSSWDGRTGAFSQFVDDGAAARLSTRDYGVFHDAGDFYAQAGERWNRRNPVMTIALTLTVAGINRRLDAMRAEALAEAVP
jgi:transglutaminase-like putative cysteine protease